MVYDCGSCMVKYVLCAFNFIIFVTGSVVLGVGIWLLVDKNSFIALIKIIPVENIEQFTSAGVIEQASYILVAVGAFMFLVSFLGYCGALKESRCMLTLYGILLIAILLLEIAAGVLAFTYKSKAEDETKNIMKASIEKYYNSTDHKDAVTVAWDALQISLRCCGVDDYTDYQDNKAWKEQDNIIPPSCCALNSENQVLDPTCTTTPTLSNSYYKTGCYQKIIEWIMANLNIIILTAGVLGLIEVLGILFAFCLTKSISAYEK
ncbi:CD82 antigen-like [Sitophilus oryzae]|uniref:Tetraspanin n=1 Tax=Sitophilus oryzae TaxID=7048 RepID=A0A6J2XEX6_SITOR|nr:CD82 antigen-like [Sitophilus oryzae]